MRAFSHVILTKEMHLLFNTKEYFLSLLDIGKIIWIYKNDKIRNNNNSNNNNSYDDDSNNNDNNNDNNNSNEMKV